MWIASAPRLFKMPTQQREQCRHPTLLHGAKTPSAPRKIWLAFVVAVGAENVVRLDHNAGKVQSASRRCAHSVCRPA